MNLPETQSSSHVRGYKKEGTITTPLDMRVQNDMDRFHLVEDILFRVPQYGNQTALLFQKMEHKQYIHEYGQDLPVT